METRKNSKFHYAWVIMFCGCCIVGIQLGVFAYTIGNFYLPVSQSLGVGVGDVALYQTMQAFASALMFPTATKLMNKYGMRKVLTVATLSAALAYAAMSQVNNLWTVYLCAVWIGLSSAFYGGATVPGMINNWFAKNNGTIYGTCLAVGALVGVAANPIIAAVGDDKWQKALGSPAQVIFYMSADLLTIEELGGHLVLNPGSVSIPKGGSVGSYMTYEKGTFLWKDLDGEVYDTLTL